MKIDYKQYQLDLLRSIPTDESLVDKSKISKALCVLGKGRTRSSKRPETFTSGLDPDIASLFDNKSEEV